MKCLLNVIDPWVKSSDEGKINLTTFLDLKKAFDTVDHKTLLLKLRKYGIESTSYNWFTSYLANREQFCHWNGSNSSRDRNFSRETQPYYKLKYDSYDEQHSRENSQFCFNI